MSDMKIWKGIFFKNLQNIKSRNLHWLTKLTISVICDVKTNSFICWWPFHSIPSFIVFGDSLSLLSLHPFIAEREQVDWGGLDPTLSLETLRSKHLLQLTCTETARLQTKPLHQQASSPELWTPLMTVQSFAASHTEHKSRINREKFASQSFFHPKVWLKLAWCSVAEVGWLEFLHSTPLQKNIPWRDQSKSGSHLKLSDKTRQNETNAC